VRQSRAARRDLDQPPTSNMDGERSDSAGGGGDEESSSLLPY
jgi:hypothetical protein